MLSNADVRQINSLLNSGALSGSELLQYTKERIETWEPLVEAFVHIDEKAFDSVPSVSAETRQMEQTAVDIPGHSSDLRLAGIPIAIKDMIDVKGMPTTGGSAAYRFVPDKDAHAVAKLRSQGAVIVGKTNTQELAFGVVTEPTKNPWNLNHIPGGSSGGSAVAVATGMSLGALGTDTGGSVRIPASCCGIVGFKPSVGLISKQGVMPLSTTLDHVGVLTRSVGDAKDLFDVIRGFDPRDEGSVIAPILRAHPPAVRVLGIPWSYFEQITSEEVLSAFRKSIGILEKLGYQTQEVEFPDWDEWRTLQLTIRLPEAYDYHRSVLEGDKRALLRGDLAQRLDGGKQIRAVEYVAARKRRSDWIYQWMLRMNELDVLVLPTLLTTAPRVGESVVTLKNQSLPIWEALTYLTAPINVLGFPAISLPGGFDSAGLPIGLQLVGFPYEDDFLLELAQTYEAATPVWEGPNLPLSKE